MTTRTDTGSRRIRATPQAIYRALLDPFAVATWRPPSGMTARIELFEPREGGHFRMAYIYDDASTAGKTEDNVDAFEGEFAELISNQRVTERIAFKSDDPAFAGTMTIVTDLMPAEGGTEVTVTCTGVPSGIDAEDHREGIASSLANLAAYTEKPISA